MKLQKLTLSEWQEMSENAHLACFNEIRPKEMNTFDYALLVTSSDDVPLSYATFIDMDSDSIYMQHGGAFPSSKGTAVVARSYHLIMNYLREHYTQATTRILNKNRAMLRLADSAGFLINGCDVHGDEVFLHLINKFEKSGAV